MTEADRVRAPNIRDVAAHAGVSYQTVSRVLNDSPAIRPATRDRVLAAIAELGFRPNQAARMLVTSRSRTIGVLSSDPNSHYGPTTALTSIELFAREAGYRLSITTIEDADAASIRSGLDYLLSQAVEALVVIAPQRRVFDVIGELSITVPFITLEAPDRDASHSLSIDQIAGARLATRHLLDLGHRAIAHLAGPQDWIEAAARAEGFAAELADAGLAGEVFAGDWTADSGYRAGLALLDGGFTAVFSANDQMALGLLHACRERGVRVPEQLSIVGFDDLPEAAHFSPPLTTVRQDFAEVGRRAISLLLAELDGVADRDHAPVAAELVLRESTAPAA